MRKLSIMLFSIVVAVLSIESMHAQTLPTSFSGCNGTAFLTDSEQTQLRTINLATGNVTNIGPMGFNINAMGFNVVDNRVYAIEHSASWIPTNNLVVMGDGYLTSKVPLIYESGVTPFSMQGYEVQEGSVSDSGYLYVRVNTSLYKIDVNPERTATFAHVYPTAVNNLSVLNTYDWAFAPTGNRYLFSIVRGDLIRLDIYTGNSVVLARNVLSSGGSNFGAVFFDNLGNFYAKENNSGHTYIIRNVTTGININASHFSSGPSVTTTHNDGARCAAAPQPIIADFSDSPLSYFTLAVVDGPRHLLPAKNNATPLIRFGSSVVSADEDGMPSLRASNDLDDGITIFDVNNAGIVPEIISSYSVTANITNNSGRTGYVSAWMDWNNNGVYDTGEKVTAVVNNNFSGEMTITWNNVELMGESGDEGTYARFRISTDSNSVALPVGLAPDGEVEDYYIKFAHPLINIPLPVSFGSVNAIKSNGNIHITWVTKSESNVDRFEIEASKTGTENSFVKIATVKSKAENGNSTQELSYDFSFPVNNTPYLLGLSLLSLLSLGSLIFVRKNKMLSALIGVIAISSVTFISCKKEHALQKENLSEYKYFRIKQVDKDGKFNYSEIFLLK